MREQLLWRMLGSSGAGACEGPSPRWREESDDDKGGRAHAHFRWRRSVHGDQPQGGSAADSRGPWHGEALDRIRRHPAFHAAPKDLRNVIEYPLSEAAFYKNSWVQFCSEDPADEDPASFVKQIDARVFAERREMTSDDRAKIATSLQEIRNEGWR
jgi:hypothetical protein